MSELLHDEIVRLHERFDSLHTRFDAIGRATLQALHLLISRDATMDHAALLDAVKAVDAMLDEKVDAAVAGFESLAATHTAVSASLDDIGAIVAGMPAKLGKLDALKAPASAPAGATLTLATPAEAGSSTLTVTGATDDHVGAAVSGVGIVSGTTITDVDPNPATGTAAVTLSDSTVDDHAAGAPLVVTPTAS